MSCKKRKPDSPASSEEQWEQPRARPKAGDTHDRAPPLPPSSGDVAVPEASASHLFSVYSFLRSFSRQLFLSPFTLDDLVRALNRAARDSLIDAAHLALLRALRRHLEARAAEGDVRAACSLRHRDWALLDAVTWPVFLTDFLYTMGYTRELAGDGFVSAAISGKEYYSLPAGVKLKALQILCDEITDSTELRAELEMREDVEEEEELGTDTGLQLENGPRRVHPRNSKTKACKDAEALKSSVEPELNHKLAESVSEAAEDGNSDECWLCGMDGMLICCDGCPSAYHSRCIGLSKAFLPEGLWFCPECRINKTGPTCSRVARGVRAAEFFGIDMYERMFLGTCNYLLVVGMSLNAEPFVRYYHQDDVPRVLRTLSLSGENASIYADICKGITEYWEIQPVSMDPGTTESIADLLLEKQPSITSANKTPDACSTAGEYSKRAVIMKSMDNGGILGQKDDCVKAGTNDGTSDTMDQAHSTGTQKNDSANQAISPKKMLKGADENSLLVRDEKVALGSANLTSQKLHVRCGNESVSDISYSSQRYAQRLTLVGTTASASGKNGVCKEDVDSSVSSSSTKSRSLSVPHDTKYGSHTSDEKSRTQSERSANNAASSKPQTYINQYVLGDVAASAAANLAVLVSEDSRVSQTGAYSNPRKTVAANIAMQMKAFSGASMYFMWPSSEKKLMEVPRERCGWCIACKGAATNKKGCLLNLAAFNAIKASARCMSNLCLIRHGESHLPVIAAHILNMEESLHGLIVGPLVDAEYKKEWHKQLRETSSCRVLKFLLLELEKNIRGIAFSESWNKPVSDSAFEFSVSPIGMTSSVPNQKRGAVGRRNKRQSIASDSDTSLDKSWEWWRGGKFSKIVFQKATLPGSLLKKTARQGGSRRISGIYYLEDSEFPRRKRQFAWIASVEMSKNASQLAVQVRYLDAHIRWKDLVRPEQVSLDGKGLDADASIFRNAVICDKKIVGNKQLYALTFLNQKHLPLRVTKNILEAEKTEEENEKLWFSEVHIPLYLIKEYEEKVGLKILHSEKVIPHFSPKMRRSRLKSYAGDIFVYLFHKGEKPSKWSCASCKKDVSLRDAIKCKTCQGYCHEDCTISSSVLTEDDMEFSFICKTCFHAQSAEVNRSNKENLSSQLPIRGQDWPLTSNNGLLRASNTAPLVGMIGCRNTAQPVGMIGHHNAAQPITRFGCHPTAQVVIKSDVKSTAQSVGRIGNLGPTQPIAKFGYCPTVQTVKRETQNTAQPVGEIRNHTAARLIVKFGCHPTEEVVVKGDRLDPKFSASVSNSERKAKHGGLSLTYGLIWKKKKGDDSGNDFKLQNIVLKSKEGMESSRKPTCCLCKMAYRPDLMYIRCEKCLNWYHADALQLEETRIFDLVGFKCCKCRRKTSPKCPYVNPYYQKPDVESLKKEDVESSEAVPCGLPEIAFSPPLAPHSENEDLVISDDGDDPLLHSSAIVEPITMQKTEADVHLSHSLSTFQCHQKLSVRRPKILHGMNVERSQTTLNGDPSCTASSESLQKLPVRRNDGIQLEAEVEGFSVSEEGDIIVCTEKASSTQMEWDPSDMGGFGFGTNKGADFDAEIGDMESMEYEPQTYFSFTELLASEDGQLDNSFDMSMDMPEDWCAPSGFNDGSGTILQDGSSYDPPRAPYKMELASTEPASDELPCQKCKHNQPLPDLMCEICGLLIHSHCSPWIEPEVRLGDTQWRCGSCRDWQ